MRAPAGQDGMTNDTEQRWRCVGPRGCGTPRQGSGNDRGVFKAAALECEITGVRMAESSPSPYGPVHAADMRQRMAVAMAHGRNGLVREATAIPKLHGNHTLLQNI